MSSERPSPFTIPKPEYVFSEGPLSLPLPFRPMPVELLIAKLLEFAESYELATDQIQTAPNFEKRYAAADRDCNAEYLQRVFRAVLGIDRVRTYVLSQYGEELTIISARRFLGDLIRLHKLTVAQAGALLLDEAMDRLDPDAKAAEYARFVELRELAASPEKHRVPLETLSEFQRLLVKFGVYEVDGIFVGPPEPTRVPNLHRILNTDCIPISGKTPLVCPRSSPKLPVELLPRTDERFRALRLVGDNQAVLWVGRQARMETICMYGKGCNCFGSPTPETGMGGSEGVKPKPNPMSDGPFDADGFRYAGVEVKFGNAAKQYRLVLSLWVAEKRKLALPRPVEDVIAEVWGSENDTNTTAQAAPSTVLASAASGTCGRRRCGLGGSGRWRASAPSR